MIDNGWGMLDETKPEIMQRTGATGAHWHIGKDTTITPTDVFFNYVRKLSAKTGLKLPSKEAVIKILQNRNVI